MLKAADYIVGTETKAAFVATNSISQGEQPAILWSYLNSRDMHIDFAHRSFRWTNEAKGKAAVHVVIIGFSQGYKPMKKRLWAYSEVGGVGTVTEVSTINAYLVAGPDILVEARRSPFDPEIPLLKPGSVPRDGGILSKLTPEDASAIRQQDPVAAKYLRRIYGALEHIQGYERWCLWLEEATPGELKSSVTLHKRIAAVRAERLGKLGAKGAASSMPGLFAQISQPTARFLLIPSVSSEKRDYLPCSFYEHDSIITNAVFAAETESLSIFGLVSSRAFTAWIRAVSSRMKSDYQLSEGMVYNTFPWPSMDSAQRAAVELAAHAVLFARDKHGDSTLGDLYDPLTMPADLIKTHKKLDKAVLATYGLKPSVSDAELLAHLFRRYEALSTAPSYTPNIL